MLYQLRMPYGLYCTVHRFKRRHSTGLPGWYPEDIPKGPRHQQKNRFQFEQGIRIVLLICGMYSGLRLVWQCVVGCRHVLKYHLEADPLLIRVDAAVSACCA